MQTEEEKNSAIIRDALRKNLRTYFRQTLKPLGFVGNSTRIRWFRESESLRQSCMFCFPRPWYVRIEYWYQFVPCFDCWEDIPRDSQSLQTFERLKAKLTDFYQVTMAYSEYRDWELPSNLEELDVLHTEVDDFFNKKIFPFFNVYQHSADILSKYNSGVIGDKYICSSNEPWFSFDLAMLRYSERKYVETYELLRKFLSYTKYKIQIDDDDFWETICGGVELAVESLKKRISGNNEFKGC